MIVEVEIKKLKEHVYVRKALDEEHWFLLACLLDGGVELPPIKISEDYVVLEGRHTVRAHQYLGREKIKAEIVDVKGTLEQIKFAVKANAASKLPLNRQDLQHCMEVLVEQNYTHHQIIGEFKECYPMGMLRSISQSAKSAINQRRTRKALDLMAETPTLSPQEAAKLVNLNVDTLQRAIAKKPSPSPTAVASFKGNFKQRFTAFNRGVGQEIRTLITRWEDGEVSTEDIDKCIVLYQMQARNVLLNCQDASKRWGQKRQTQT